MKNEKKTRIIGSILLAAAFSSEEWKAAENASLNFFINFLYNFLFVFAIWTLTKCLRLDKQWSSSRTFSIAISISLLPELIALFFTSNSKRILLELFSSSIPSAIIVIGGIHIYYQYLLSQNQLTYLKPETPEIVTEASIKLTTIKGKTQIGVDQLSFIHYLDGKTLVYNTAGESLVCFDPLNSLITVLREDDRFFKLNRSAIVHRSAIQKYQTQKDSRIRVWIHDQECLVSKNNALKFKRWFEGS
ncbi:MAG: LytTR family DNA-binding domain-containing protein [Saprospiraceae bacterium]